MKFDGTEIGGKHAGSLKVKLFGDREAAQNLIGSARAILGRLKQFMQLSEITWHQTDVTLPNGSAIHAQSNTAGLADVDEIWISVPIFGKKDKKKRNKLRGFLVNLSAAGEFAPDSLSIYVHYLYMKWPEAKAIDYELLSINGLDVGVQHQYEPKGRDDQFLVPGAIPDTYDQNPDLQNTDEGFFYWDVTYHADPWDLGPPEAIGVIAPPDEVPPNLPFQIYTGYAPAGNPATDGSGKLSPFVTNRNDKRHVAGHCKATLSDGVIKCLDTENDGFIAVVPDKLEINFDDISWDDKKTQYDGTGTAYQVFDVDIGGNVPELELLDVFPDYPSDRVTLGVMNITQSVTERNFKLNSLVDDGDYYLWGAGDITVYLLTDNEIITHTHTFPPFEGDSHGAGDRQAVVLSIGREFTDVGEVVVPKDVRVTATLTIEAIPE